MPIFAICFGAQAIAMALGGSVIKHPKSHKIATFHELPIAESFWAQPWAGNSRPIWISEGHGDLIREVPGAVVHCTTTDVTGE
ncbi:MAG: gamma-glutamyl-gamma-aminobutyrate hydrolase family protein, partial [Kangiellaceae bacterium]|nr:gamma-glutamyl-gamma-aminobutyrate hydrolase family protein [Kangiellaceae bacterium]